MRSMSRSRGDASLASWSYDEGGWDSTSYDDSYHNRNFQPWPCNTHASYHLHPSACRHHHYSSPPRRPQYMPPSPPPQYIPPPQHYQQPQAWTSEPTNQPRSMEALLLMLRSVEARLDDIEQRWSRVQSPPRPEPDPLYGLTPASPSPSWNHGPIPPNAVAATEIRFPKIDTHCGGEGSATTDSDDDSDIDISSDSSSDYGSSAKSKSESISIPLKVEPFKSDGKLMKSMNFAATASGEGIVIERVTAKESDNVIGDRPFGPKGEMQPFLRKYLEMIGLVHRWILGA